MPSGLAAALPRALELPPAACAPPRGFRSAEGLRSAWPSESGPFGRSPTPIRGSGAQRAGLRYERKVKEHLAGLLEGFVPGPWFKFLDRTNVLRWCQPDGLWRSRDGSNAIIFEVKIRFVASASFQLARLYEPVIRAAYRPRRVALVTICRAFDPIEPSLLPVHHVENVSSEDVLLAPEGRMCVFEWRP